MDEGVFLIVSEGLLAGADGKVEMLRLALAIADAEPGQAAHIAPDIPLSGALLASDSGQVTERVVIDFARQLTVEVTQLEIALIFSPGFGEFAGDPQAVGQPHMRLGRAGVQLDRLTRRIDRLRIQFL